MTKEQILQKLRSVFDDVFEGHSTEISESTTANDIEEWDSLTNIELMVAVEKKFDIKLTSSDINNLQNVGDLCRVVQTKIAA
ncbi:acyl carrier protein [Flavisolibacter ginsenosidimutans]|uniref:Acyl carrier protein n=1 Tax=Flavisolibacter ginsenosidimutans TaxID=661481 RepID=A0A5B8UED1_9BACT|nr:acyl carrier protein [Flavisolibacter ginsenosidimutans]QEC54863.1 acyl carrier protein [Flavisolibacter ginsenosidimutans]